jgi:hypothetical protein
MLSEVEAFVKSTFERDFDYAQSDKVLLLIDG